MKKAHVEVDWLKMLENYRDELSFRVFTLQVQAHEISPEKRAEIYRKNRDLTDRITTLTNLIQREFNDQF